MPKDDYILRSDALKAILGVSIYDTIEELDGARTIAENTWADGLYDAYKIIEEEVDAADVEPVRHGRWVNDSDNIPHCSECEAIALQRHKLYLSERIFEVPFVLSKCCPECGAHMDAEPPKEDDDAKVC